jgi:N-acylmannosamine kinase
MTKATIAIDVGGTKISALLIRDDVVLERRKVDSVIHTDLTNLAEHLYQLCHGWVEQAEHLAIACTGQVRRDSIGFLSAKQQLPLQQQLSQLFKLPLTIINDAAAAAYAQFVLLKQQGLFSGKTETLVYITVSTGVGGGIMQNSQLVLSDDGFCAHLGHVTVPHDGAPILCHCGRENCVEAIASGTALAKRGSLLLGRAVNTEDVFALSDTEPAMARIIDEAASALTSLIANAKAWTGCQYVVIGGSVGTSALFYLVQQKLLQLPAIYQATLLKPSNGADADAWGVYWYSMRHLASNDLNIETRKHQVQTEKIQCK